MKTIDLAKEQPSLADVLVLARSEPIVIHSGPGEDFVLEPADEFDREVVALGGSEEFLRFLQSRSDESGDTSIEVLRKKCGA